MSEERKTIYLCLAHMSDEGLEQKYVKEAFDTNWVVPMGPNVNAFEKDLEAFVNGRTGLRQGSDAEPVEANGSYEKVASTGSATQLDRKVVCLSAVRPAALSCKRSYTTRESWTALVIQESFPFR